jgi:hypothetical protein
MKCPSSSLKNKKAARCRGKQFDLSPVWPRNSLSSALLFIWRRAALRSKKFALLTNTKFPSCHPTLRDSQKVSPRDAYPRTACLLKTSRIILRRARSLSNAQIIGRLYFLGIAAKGFPGIFIGPLEEFFNGAQINSRLIPADSCGQIDC